MNTAFGKLARLASWSKPTPATPLPVRIAEAKLGTVPTVVDTAAWYEAHSQLCYDLQVAAVRAASDQDAEAEVAKAHAALLAHAAIINGGSGPVLLAKDGIHPIPFERLAAARAKIKVLEAENARLRAAGGAGS